MIDRHRKLLFRSYFFLVAGLLSVAAVLDLGFSYLQSSQTDQGDQWLTSSFHLIETELADAPPGERAAVAERLADELGVGVQVLSLDDVATIAESQGSIGTLVDAAGNTSYLREAPTLNGHIRLGPIQAEEQSVILRMLPPIFYLSIFVIVGLWLRPLLKDLNLITGATQRFAADYREPFETSDKTTQLKTLAKNLDEMSVRLSGLIQSQKELIAALSHEMRTPLARIRFALAVMKDKCDDEQKDQLDELENDVQEIDQLIGTMLDYARLDHPDLSMNWQQVPLGPWLEQTTEKCRPPDKMLSIDRDEAVDTARMDPRLMSLALSNLLTNAGRYAKDGVRCSIGRREGNYRLGVEDDGHGIPVEERQTVFKVFTRLDDSRNRETGGYGLGLAIVSRIASLHGGSIVVEDSPELGGARFLLSWPVRED